MSDTFRNRLQQLLDEHNMKAVDLANAIDAPKARISQWMHNKTNPNADSLYKVSKYFNVSEGWLLGQDVPRNFDRDQLEKKVEACDIIEQCFGIQAREVVRKLLNLNDAGVLVVNKYVDFLAEQPEYQIEPKKDAQSSGKKAM